MFEVQDLRFATMATVSRCGMVWFSEDVLSTELIFENFLSTLRNVPVEETEDVGTSFVVTSSDSEEKLSPLMQVR